MSELHVFDVGEEWVVARDAQDAAALCAELYGPTWWREFDCESPDEAIAQCDDAKTFTIRVNAEGKIAEDGELSEGLTLTFGEWAQREGRGALASLNY